jgi:hypoxanthine-DNA glycosylase
MNKVRALRALETHPYISFVPKDSKYLILGSFPGLQSYDFFYGSVRNQFWRILESVYGVELKTKEDRQKLFIKLKIAISDVILSCERSKGNNSDTNLTNITFNNKVIGKILETNDIKTIYFTSKFVEGLFRKHFQELIQKYPNIEFITLPSPSARYAKMSFTEKIIEYKKLLPKT